MPHVSELTDSSEVYSLEKRLSETSDAMVKMIGAIGKARQITEFSGDMRKRALAKAVTPFLDQGESAAAADAKGRGSFNYGEELKELKAQLIEAETVKAEWEALRIRFEATRSLLSAQKEMSRM